MAEVAATSSAAKSATKIKLLETRLKTAEELLASVKSRAEQREDALLAKIEELEAAQVPEEPAFDRFDLSPSSPGPLLDSPYSQSKFHPFEKQSSEQTAKAKLDRILGALDKTRTGRLSLRGVRTLFAHLTGVPEAEISEKNSDVIQFMSMSLKEVRHRLLANLLASELHVCHQRLFHNAL